MTADMKSRSVGEATSGFDRTPPSRDRKLNKGQAAGALLVMILSGLAAVLLFSRSQATVLVWESTRDLEPGLVLQADDFRAVELPASSPIRGIDASHESLVGSIVSLDIPVGTLINDSMVVGASADGGAEPTIGRVGLVLEANQYPEGVSVGDTLRVIELDPEALAKRDLEPLVESLTVTVLSVTVAPGNSSELWITVSAPLDFVDRLALMSSLEQIATAKVG